MATFEWLGTEPGGRWPDERVGPWQLRLHFAKVDGAVRCVGIDIRGFRGAEYQPDGSLDPARPLTRGGEAPELTTSVLRGLRLAELKQEARKTGRALKNYASQEAVPEHIRARAAEVAAAYEEKRQTRGRPRVPLERLEEVAAVYLDALWTGKPTQAVAARFTVSQSTAAKWVMACRDVNLLAPATTGKHTSTKKAAPKKRGTTKSSTTNTKSRRRK